MEQEIWKPINNYEDYYEISNFGKIRRIRYDNTGNKAQYKLPYYIKYRKDRDGYFRCTLCINRNNKSFYVHRLIAQAFIPNPNNYPCINHIDGNKENISISNLEWCTYSQNNLHALRNGLRNMKNNKLSKQVEQYDMNGNLLNTFKSANEAKRITGLSQSHISTCCRGEYQQYKGYVWKYKIN